MARLKITATDEYASKLSKLGDKSEPIIKTAIYEGAAILADTISNNLSSVLSGDSTGDLQKSLGITPILKDKKGIWNAKVGFDGYDSKGTPNQLKARVLESGSSKQKKRPFIAPAVNSTRVTIISVMGQIIDKEIEKLMK